MLDFYSNLFSSSNSCQPKLALESVQGIVIEDMNGQLLAKFSEGEVKMALNQMAPLKPLVRMAYHPSFINIIGIW